MSDPEANEPSDETPPRVGVLLVHGMGEQKSLDHLRATAADIVRALEADAEVSVSTRFTDEPGAVPLTITVRRSNGGAKTVLEFREVFWADLDEPATLWNQIKFWFWGFSIWAVRQISDQRRKIPGAKNVRLPTGKYMLLEHVIARGRLLFVGIFFVPVLFLLLFVNFVLRRFGLTGFVGPDLMYRVVGDVKLYQQDRWSDRDRMLDPGQPPRVTIRRRMVVALVEMALARYDRWYVLAHSLGSIIAWNGLMETDHALPNYLNEDLWKRCLATPIDAAGTRLVASLSDIGSTHRMMPRRPPWIRDDDAVISRSLLFGGLRGFLTYGSPLNKFGYLWPGTVPINDEPAFAEDFEWINVHDPQDPVAGRLKERWRAGPVMPLDVAYIAHPVLMLNHIRYTRQSEADRFRLANVVGQWISTGTPFPDIGKRGWRWLPQCAAAILNAGRVLQWLAAFVLAVWLTSVAYFLIADVIRGLQQDSVGLAVSVSQLCGCAEPRAALRGGSEFWPMSQLFSTLWAMISWPFVRFGCLDKWWSPFAWTMGAAAVVCILAGTIRFIRDRIVIRQRKKTEPRGTA